FPRQIRDIFPLPPVGRRSDVRSMPEVIRVSPAQDRLDSHAGHSQPQPQIIIFATPAFEILVVTVDQFVITTPYADIVADQLRLPRMPQPLIEPRFAILLSQPLQLLRRRGIDEFA